MVPYAIDTPKHEVVLDIVGYKWVAGGFVFAQICARTLFWLETGFYRGQNNCYCNWTRRTFYRRINSKRFGKSIIQVTMMKDLIEILAALFGIVESFSLWMAIAVLIGLTD